MKQDYSTNQRRILTEFLEKNKSSDFSPTEILDFFKNKGLNISRATIYRNLNKLEKDGIIKKYPLKKRKEAAFQFCGEKNYCDSHFHLKCLSCGNLIHLECDYVNHFSEHIYNEHKFTISKSETIFYGYCKDCQ